MARFKVYELDAAGVLAVDLSDHRDRIVAATDFLFQGF
ncbi:MAG: CcdB family protein [Proteobacteria bacterium]|nr:CcdB family protein [Pseudomonadota bacterium]